MLLKCTLFRGFYAFLLTLYFCPPRTHTRRCSAPKRCIHDRCSVWADHVPLATTGGIEGLWLSINSIEAHLGHLRSSGRCGGVRFGKPLRSACCRRLHRDRLTDERAPNASRHFGVRGQLFRPFDHLMRVDCAFCVYFFRGFKFTTTAYGIAE